MKTIDKIFDKCKKILHQTGSLFYPIKNTPSNNYDFSEDWPKDYDGKPLTPSRLVDKFYSNKQ